MGWVAGGSGLGGGLSGGLGSWVVGWSIDQTDSCLIIQLASGLVIWSVGRLANRVDHLVCFLIGTLLWLVNRFVTWSTDWSAGQLVGLSVR